MRNDIVVVVFSNISCVTNKDAFFVPSYIVSTLSLSFTRIPSFSLYIYVIDVIGSDAEEHSEKSRE
jgi:hypothetical protein